MRAKPLGPRNQVGKRTAPFASGEYPCPVALLALSSLHEASAMEITVLVVGIISLFVAIYFGARALQKKRNSAQK
jgi:hypothetical protein